jgi:5-methylcytosine-specific restriction endonuclease McrA
LNDTPIPNTMPQPHIEAPNKAIKQLRKKLYICKLCGKEYKYKAAYKNHKKTHIDLKSALLPSGDIVNESRRIVDINQAQKVDRHGNRYRGTNPTLKAISNITKAQDNIQHEAERIRKATGGRRWASNVYSIVYALLVSRDGATCAYCGTVSNLQVDHINGNIHDNRPENLCLLCQEHNLEFRGLNEATKRQYLDSALNLRERENKKADPDELAQIRLNRLRIAGKPTDKGERSPIEANATYERRFRQYVQDTIAKVKCIYKQELILSGAEYCDCSQQSTSRYLEKMTSSTGAYVEHKTPNGAIIMLKANANDIKAAGNE